VIATSRSLIYAASKNLRPNAHLDPAFIATQKRGTPLVAGFRQSGFSYLPPGQTSCEADVRRAGFCARGHIATPANPGINQTILFKVVLLLPIMKTRDLNAALQIFRDKGGTLRTRDVIALGVHTDALYELRDSGQIVELGRGLYRLAEISEAEYPDLAVIAARTPKAAVCLISALSYHGITTQIPSSIHLAVPRGSYHGIKLSMPVTVYRFDPKTFKEGLETHRIGEMPLKVYSAARTVVDCFKFRNKLGLDVPLEALRLARQRKRVQNRELLRYARLLRVEKPMSPYLQAIE
jgi:predicted transcriptional regulator of viral defense system